MALWTYDFLDRLGVVTHVRYSDGAYRDHAGTLEKLRYLGLDRIRDTAPKAGAKLPYKRYLDAGVRFCMSCSPSGAAVSDASRVGEVLDRILAAFPGARGVDFLEGPNEPNNQPIAFAGVKDTKTSFEAVKSYMAALHPELRRRREFDQIPLLGVANYPRLQVASDMENEHPYPMKGTQPRSAMAKVLTGRKRPVVITEFGYNTGPPSRFPTPVDEYTQALLTLNGLFDAVSLGARRTYVYELLDEKPDPDFKTPNLHWGLFRYDGTPKIAARALHNLTRILRPEANAGPSGPDPKVTGLPPTARSMALQKGPGSSLVVLWNEPDIWDEAGLKPIRVAASQVQVAFPKARALRLYDPMQDERPVKEAGPSDSLKVQLGAFPQIVEIVRT
ncbi:hypothetical protein [Phenylobacterium koreense]|uniref:Uncharacterized protein n=1 Tax=Phenylobacterium koreense TaxID=266125 RepID=A0ABV2ENJ0_9CAUL